MTDQTQTEKKESFWGGLLRRASVARRASKASANRDEPQQSYSAGDRDGDGDTIQLRRRRTMPESNSSSSPAINNNANGFTYRHHHSTSRPRQPLPQQQQQQQPTPLSSQPASQGPPARRRRRRPHPEPDAGGLFNGIRRGSGAGSPHGRSARAAFAAHGPLSSWPPSGMSSMEELPPQHAQELIARGVPSHRGHKRPVPHAGDEFYALYATSSGNRNDAQDRANLHDAMIQMTTVRMLGPGRAETPWETLEQPSRAFATGSLPGTITLNQWASMSSNLPPTIALSDSGVVPRDMSLERIFERLQELRHGLEDDDENLLYRILYKRILRDPDKMLSPHKTLDKQITDLILVLSRPDWIDFTNPRNQVATRFIFDTSPENQAQYHKFFHQLLLSLELELRIQSTQHDDWAKERLLYQIPPTIQWGLALARRWKEHVRVDDFGKTPEDILLRYKLKKRQVKMLKRFAQMLKWPNLADTLHNMKQKDSEMALDDISSDAFAFFSGLILPGPTFPFLIMNTLIDMDPDGATDELALLTHMHPHCGFQYRSSYTYWSVNCIVGKVLAPTCHSVAGWVGPARPTPDLGRSQIARIRARRPKQRMTAEDVESMGERSDPLGPPAEVFPVHEYKLVTPTAAPDDPVDTVRIEMLSLRAADRAEDAAAGPRLFDATVQFAIDGMSWPLRLMYDVSFITAWPCSDGPHPLFWDYVYTSIKVDAIVGVRDWGGLYGGPAKAHSVRSSPGPGMMRHASNGNGRNGDHMHGFLAMRQEEEAAEDDDSEKVLVVEAFGVRDNEVLARAWCSHWGLSAVVADVRKTCMACAIREAYAATLTVVILVEGQEYELND